MKNAIAFRLLTTIAIILFVVIYFTPIWQVTLQPIVPPEGVPINIHVNGPFNGAQPKEIVEDCDEVLLFVHEMDILAHFVGMYPTSAGAPIMRVLSQFLFAFLIVLLIAFMISGRKLQAAALSVGFGAIVIWGYLTLFTPGGATWLSEGYQQFLQCDMDLDAKDMQDWSGIQAMQEGFRDAIGRWPRPDSTRATVEEKVNFITTAAYVVIGILIIGMLVLIVGLLWKKVSSFVYWLLGIIPILLPVFFVIVYAGWLYWAGHTLGGGQIQIAPFMPPVIGEAMVAKFKVTNFPLYGFGLMILSSVLLIIATSLRLKQLRESSDD